MERGVEGDLIPSFSLCKRRLKLKQTVLEPRREEFHTLLFSREFLGKICTFRHPKFICLLITSECTSLDYVSFYDGNTIGSLPMWSYAGKRDFSVDFLLYLGNFHCVNKVFLYLGNESLGQINSWGLSGSVWEGVNELMGFSLLSWFTPAFLKQGLPCFWE